MKMSTLKSFQPVVLPVLYIMMVYLFLLCSMAEFFSFPMSIDGTSEGLILVTGILEAVGGILLILGLPTRPSAFVLSGQMAVAYLMVYVSSGNVLFPSANQGEPVALFCLVFLCSVVVGNGAWVLDSVFGKDKG